MDEINGKVTNKDLHDALRTVHGRIDEVFTALQSLVSGQGQANQHIAGLNERVGKLRESTNDALHVMDDRIKVLETPWKLLGRGWVAFVAGVGAATGVVTLLARLGAWPF